MSSISELTFSKNTYRDIPPLRFAAPALRGFFRALKCTYESTLCRAQRTIDFQERPARVPNTGTRAGLASVPRNREMRSWEMKRDKETEREKEMAARVSCVCTPRVLHVYTINAPAYRSRTRDSEVALLAVRRRMAIFHRSNP